MSDLETKLRTLFDVPSSNIPPEKRIQHLGAFWPAWNLHKRKCDKTNKEIISVFRPDCPYPVWHKDEWFKNAKPPQAKFDFQELFFPQTERLFKQCPIFHLDGVGSENCDYTDDWWHSRNCYLSHHGLNCEDSRYLYRTIQCNHSCYCVFSNECLESMDAVNCEKCFRVVYMLYCHNCQNCAFCYDCRNCHDCLFCFNLRNKQYCIGNKQFTKDQFEVQKRQYEYATISGYERCKQMYRDGMKGTAWLRPLYMDFCEKSNGDYITNVKLGENVYFCNPSSEEVYNVVRGGWSRTLYDVINFQDVEKVYMSAGIQIKCYNVYWSFMVQSSRDVWYSAYSRRNENIFGCCGLLDGKNCIMNTPYSVEEYSSLKQKMIDHMKSTGEWGQFFPGSFAPNPYDESWSSFYFPLSPEEQKRQGYFYLPNPERKNSSYLSIEALPSTAQDATEVTTKNVYWDDIAGKPFQILPQDINFCRELGVPLPNSYYMRRLQENFRWMPYNGTLRTTKCAKSGKEIQTSWPSEYNGRILSEEEYLKIIA